MIVLRKLFKGAAKFLLMFYVMTIVCTVAWAVFIDGKLYNCTDGVMGYPIPVDLLNLWHDQWPLKFVSHVNLNDNIGDPDTIKQGWTAGKLWELWFAFFTASVVISALLAWLPWPSPGLFRNWRRIRDG
jgi:hypothetical protein